MIYSQSIYTGLYFFVPPKCGWSSFNKLYAEKHSKNAIKLYYQITNKLIVDVFIVRDPIDRFISAYKNKILEDPKNYIKTMIETRYGNSSLDTVLTHLQEISKLDVHFYPFNKFYDVFNTKPRYTLDINKDITEIEELFGYKIPHENCTKNTHDIVLTEQQKKIILQVYK